MKLTEFDRKCLTAGEELPGSIINAAQYLLARQFPHLKGFQDTALGLYLQFQKIKDSSVQICTHLYVHVYVHLQLLKIIMVIRLSIDIDANIKFSRTLVSYMTQKN